MPPPFLVSERAKAVRIRRLPGTYDYQVGSVPRQLSNHAFQVQYQGRQICLHAIAQQTEVPAARKPVPTLGFTVLALKLEAFSLAFVILRSVLHLLPELTVVMGGSAAIIVQPQGGMLACCPQPIVQLSVIIGLVAAADLRCHTDLLVVGQELRELLAVLSAATGWERVVINPVSALTLVWLL
jgi:hypothetical protein